MRNFLLQKFRNAFGHSPIIHLYALCWNDEKMLPYFFNHYNMVVDHYFLFDNGSTDQSIALIKANKKSTLSSFAIEGDSFVLAAQSFYNSCWKKSIGVADWVIVCNIDEILYHPMGTRKFLSEQHKKGFSVILPEGFDMVSDYFPLTLNKQIYDTIKEGCKNPRFDKPQIFNPNLIAEINFTPGRHAADPTGTVVYSKDPMIKLLHYKYIGQEYWMPRQNELKNGLRQKDIDNKWGYQYLIEDKDKLALYLEKVKNKAKII